jgi:hypothetical protein
MLSSEGRTPFTEAPFGCNGRANGEPAMNKIVKGEAGKVCEWRKGATRGRVSHWTEAYRCGNRSWKRGTDVDWSDRGRGVTSVSLPLHQPRRLQDRRETVASWGMGEWGGPHHLTNPPLWREGVCCASGCRREERGVGEDEGTTSTCGDGWRRCIGSQRHQKRDYQHQQCVPPEKGRRGCL